jgi:cell division protease FtsH
MSEKLPNLSYFDSSGHSDYGFTKPYSEKTAELIDAEAKQLIAEQYERARDILKENAEGHNKLSELLLEREVIFAEDLEEVFGKRPWSSRQDELMQLNGKSEEQTALPENTLDKAIAELQTPDDETVVTEVEASEPSGEIKNVIEEDKKSN